MAPSRYIHPLKLLLLLLPLFLHQTSPGQSQNASPRINPSDTSKLIIRIRSISKIIARSIKQSHCPIAFHNNNNSPRSTACRYCDTFLLICILKLYASHLDPSKLSHRSSFSPRFSERKQDLIHFFLALHWTGVWLPAVQRIVFLLAPARTHS